MRGCLRVIPGVAEQPDPLCQVVDLHRLLVGKFHRLQEIRGAAKIPVHPDVQFSHVWRQVVQALAAVRQHEEDIQVRPAHPRLAQGVAEARGQASEQEFGVVFRAPVAELRQGVNEIGLPDELDLLGVQNSPSRIQIHGDRLPETVRKVLQVLCLLRREVFEGHRRELGVLDLAGRVYGLPEAAALARDPQVPTSLGELGVGQEGVAILVQLHPPGAQQRAVLLPHKLDEASGR
mmetsp:Transcript_99437/g.259257  ORF Transcript_99437/g.259257 Transcript_99437/m.259257 type:complete len:234 (+) Transcript_99437:789-1490(+)